MRFWLALPLLLATLSADAQPRFWGALKPGPHRVGFRVLAGESMPGSAGWTPRPIEIAVWHPAGRGASGTVMTLGDYFAVAEDLRRRSGSLAMAITGEKNPEVDKVVADVQMFARRDAAPAAGAFPVVMWSARYGTAAAQAALSESLASHGFVVAAARPKPAAEKLPFEATTPAEKLEEIDAQGDDLRGALRAVRALPYAHDTRTALISWSYAGESAWRIAQSDARIDVVLSLDSNVHKNWVYQSRPESVPMRVPFVDVKVEGLAHGNYNMLEGMVPGVMGIERVQKWSKGGPIAKRGYETIARRVLETLQQSREAKPQFTRIDINGVTADLYRAANATRCVALFHQSGSSRGEYRTIAPELVHMGYTALAVDVRWGRQDRWNDVVNETAARHGTPAVMDRGDRARGREIRVAGMQDLDAAVDWLRANGCAKPIVWGASIHANGVLELAAKRPEHIAAVIDASPGEYDSETPDRMKGIAAQLRVPVLVLWGRTERELSKPIFDALPETSGKASHESSGRHGNAILFEDVAAWERLREFLKGVQ
jgi:dienelactone hydrolase